MTAPPPSRPWHRRAKFLVALGVGSPVVTAAMTTGAMAANFYFRLDPPLLLWRSILYGNAALAVAGPVAVALLADQSSRTTRIVAVPAFGFAGFVVHFALAYCCGGCTGLLAVAASE